MRVFTNVDEVEAKIYCLNRTALVQLAKAVGVKKPDYLRKDDLRVKITNIARGLEDPLP